MTDDAKPEEQKTERFNMFMTPSEMKAIDDWAWRHRVRSKSEAVRRLVKIGLISEKLAGRLNSLSSALVNELADDTKHIDLNPANIQAIGHLLRFVLTTARLMMPMREMRGNPDFEKAMARAERLLRMNDEAMETLSEAVEKAKKDNPE